MKRQRHSDLDGATSISEQASHWWVVLHDENVSASDRREFGEWVARSPERIAAYLRIERLMRALNSGEVRWPDVPAEALTREAKTAPVSILHPTRMLSPRMTARAAPAFGVAAVLLAVIAVSWLFLLGPERFETALGEQRSVLLDDGSLVTLNTSSQIEVTIDKLQRRVHLLAGEALFQVAPDKQRPFEVIAGGTTVRAVGTQFNVDRRSTGTTVTVVEGKVAVLAPHVSESPAGEASIYLAAAERAVITDSEMSPPEHVPNVAAATAWTQRRLVFERRPVGEVAAEFNRYNRQVIQIESAELRNEEVTGVFQANDPESFVAFLSKIPGVSVRRSAAAIRVIEAAPAPAG